jgi:hypothetical protein
LTEDSCKCRPAYKSCQSLGRVSRWIITPPSKLQEARMTVANEVSTTWLRVQSPWRQRLF